MRGPHIQPGPPSEAALLCSASVPATVEMLTVGAWASGDGQHSWLPGVSFHGGPDVAWAGRGAGGFGGHLDHRPSPPQGHTSLLGT